MLPKKYYSSPRLLEVTIPFILCISSQLTKTPALSKRNKNPCRIHERLTEDWRHALLALWFIQLKLSHHCTTHTLNRMAVPLRKTQLLSWLLLYQILVNPFIANCWQIRLFRKNSRIQRFCYQCPKKKNKKNYNFRGRHWKQMSP